VKNKWLILIVVLSATFMATLDASIVNVALPVMAGKLGVDLGGIQWVVTSYLIVISSLILVFGKLSDRVGKSAVFNWGVLLFGIGSLICSLSVSLHMLVFSRVVQALGASMFMASNQGIVATAFPPQERGRALGLLGSTVAIGSMTGPPLGGFLVDLLNWQSIFIINVPVSLGAFIAGMAILPKEDSFNTDKAFDKRGAAVLVAGITILFTLALSIHGGGGFGSLVVPGIIFSCVLLIVFYRMERGAADPILDMELLKTPFFLLSIFCAFFTFVVMFEVSIIHPYYLQNAMGFTPSHSGLLILSFPLTIFVVAPVSGYLSDKIGAKPITAVALLMLFAGLQGYAHLSLNSSQLYIICCGIFLGLGTGMFQSPNTSILMSLSPRHKMGLTGSINAFSRNLGMVSGITFGVLVLYFIMSIKAGYNVEGYIPDRPEIFIESMRDLYNISSLFTLATFVLTLVRVVKSGVKNGSPA
jgi:EmrB/QacA subfamily drug resistance transporter